MKRLALLLTALPVLLVSGLGLQAADDLKLKVKAIDLSGNQAFSSGQLLKVMVTHKTGFLSRAYYNPDDFAEDLKSLALFYRQNGYLDCIVGADQMQIDSSRHTIRIHIQIAEGPLTHIRILDISGNSLYSDSLLQAGIKVHAGDPLRQPLIQLGAQSIVNLYTDNGYLDAQVRPEIRVDSTNHTADVGLAITEGVKYTVAQTRIEGLHLTRKGVVTRELLFHTGDVVRYTKLLQVQRQLYMTGLFQSVYLRPVPAADSNSTHRDILLQLAETKPIQLNLSVGYGTVESGRASAQIFDNNIAGTALKIGLTQAVSFINHSTEMSFTEPWTLGTRWRTDLDALYQFQKQPGYNLTRRAGTVVIGRNIARQTLLGLNYRLEDARLSNITISNVPPNLAANIRSLKPSAIYDTRDDVFNTRRGWYLEGSEELAGGFLGGTNKFLRTEIQAKYFHPLGNSTVLAASAQVGTIDDFGDSSKVTLSERFYGGGPTSVRGFGYQDLGPKSANRVTLGGMFSVVLNVFEVRQVIWKFVGGAVFLDAGNVWLEPADFHLKDIRLSPGFGLRAGTPVGIIRGDWAFNIRPQDSEVPWKIWLSVGQAF